MLHRRRLEQRREYFYSETVDDGRIIYIYRLYDICFNEPATETHGNRIFQDVTSIVMHAMNILEIHILGKHYEYEEYISKVINHF